MIYFFLSFFHEWFTDLRTNFVVGETGIDCHKIFLALLIFKKSFISNFYIKWKLEVLALDIYLFNF